MINVTRHGFSLHSRTGALVAYCEHFERALAVQRETPAAVVIRRMSDGVVVAIKRGKSWGGIADQARELGS